MTHVRVHVTIIFSYTLVIVFLFTNDVLIVLNS